MAFYGYNGDVDNCHWTSYSSNSSDYEFFLPQSSSRYSFYGCEEPKVIEPRYYNDLHYDTAKSTVNYSIYSYNEPRLIQYEQPCYASEHLSPRTNHIISYSTLEFNEPPFEEYDPTPHGGGYDIAQTYGKPLPESDDICYPRSDPQSGVAFAVPEGFSYGSIPSPYGQTDDHSMKPQNGSESKPVEKKEEVTDKIDDVEEGIVEKPKEVDPTGVDEDFSYDYGKGLGNEGYDYERSVQVSYIPHGGGLEAMDLCESIFGYWPCLDKRSLQNHANGVAADGQSRIDPWKSAADYLFGSAFAYDEPRSRGNGYYVDGNQSHYEHHFDYSYH